METSTPNALTPAIAPRSSLRLRAIVLVLLINAVPLIGVLRYEWSSLNVLVLYWFENLLVAVCTCIRIAVHRRLTRKRGYWRGGQLGVQANGKPLQSGLLGEYATAAFVFTFAHGIFVGAIALILSQNFPDNPIWRFSFDQVERGVLIISAMLAIELVADLVNIRARSFAWMKDYVQRRMSRVLILHLAIIFGMLAMALTHSPLGILYVLIGLKTLVELGGVAGQNQAASPDKPPGWALNLVGRFDKDKDGATAFAKKWKQDMEKGRRNAAEDEEVVRVPPR
jgi:hypothetical protein